MPKVCDKCAQVYTGFGTTCSECRRSKKLVHASSLPSKAKSSDRCKVCGKIAYALERLSIEGETVHPTCFRCAHCSNKLSLSSFGKLSGKYYCTAHYYQLFTEKGRYDFNSFSDQGQQSDGVSVAKNSVNTEAALTKPAENKQLAADDAVAVAEQKMGHVEFELVPITSFLDDATPTCTKPAEQTTEAVSTDENQIAVDPCQAAPVVMADAKVLIASHCCENLTTAETYRAAAVEMAEMKEQHRGRAKVKAHGRIGVIVRHDPGDKDLTYKLKFSDGVRPEEDWYTEDEVELVVSESSVQDSNGLPRTARSEAGGLPVADIELTERVLPKQNMKRQPRDFLLNAMATKDIASLRSALEECEAAGLTPNELDDARALMGDLESGAAAREALEAKQTLEDAVRRLLHDAVQRPESEALREAIANGKSVGLCEEELMPALKALEDEENKADRKRQEEEIKHKRQEEPRRNQEEDEHLRRQIELNLKQEEEEPLRRQKELQRQQEDVERKVEEARAASGKAAASAVRAQAKVSQRRSIQVLSRNGEEILCLEVNEDQRMKDVKSKLVSKLGLTESSNVIKLAYGSEVLTNEDANMGDMPSPITLILGRNDARRAGVARLLEAEIPGGADKYRANGVLAPNGCTYFVPYSASRVLRIKVGGSISLVGPKIIGNSKYQAGGVLATNGCIFHAPYNAAKVLRIDADGKVELLGPELPGDCKYSASGVLAPNGCIYFAPRDAGRVLRIDAEGNVSLLEPEISGSNKYVAGGVLAPNGCIYFVPLKAASVLRIDVEGNVALLEPTISGNWKYSARGVLAPNGCTYFAPYGAGKVLCITATGSIEYLEPAIPGENTYWAGGVLAPSGCIYFAPRDAGKVLCINAVGNVELLEPTISGNWLYEADGVLAPNGCIYFAPLDAGNVLCISAEGNVELIAPNIPGYNKYVAGGVSAHDDCVYFAPHGAKQVLRINC